MNTKLMDADPEKWAGARFRELRKERGWSQEDLAQRMKGFGCRWSQATVTRLEAATRPIRLNEVASLAAAFGLKLADILTDAPVLQPVCIACHGEPPTGFTCNACGKSGVQNGLATVKKPAKGPAVIEVYGAKITEPMARHLVNELRPALERDLSISRSRHSIMTERALQDRGLMMKPGDCGPNGMRLTEKGQEVANVLIQRQHAAVEARAKAAS